MRGAWAFSSTVLAAALGGCGLVSGLSDLTVTRDSPDDGGGSSGSSGGSSSGGSSSGGSSSGGSSGDGGADTGTDTGTDAPTTGCTGTSTCAPPVPSGWTPVWFSSASRPACPGTYPTQKLLATALPSTTACQSGCGPSVDACGTGTYAVGLGGSMCSVATFNAMGGQACGALAVPINVADKATVKVTPPAGPPACNPEAATLIASGGRAGEACSGPSPGNACAQLGGASGVCLPPGNLNGPGACIMQSGAAACPPASAYSAMYLVGDSLTDTRTCSQATCAPPGSCAGGTLRLYESSTCSGGDGLGQTFDGVCHMNDNSSFRARGYILENVSGCAVQTKPQVTGGSAVFTNPQVVCCTGGN